MTDVRLRILEHVLALAPFEGWGDYTLREAAKRSGIDAGALAEVFPGGMQQCVEYFFRQSDETLAHAHPASDLVKLRMPERIEHLVLARFSYWLVHREAVRRALALSCLPWHASIQVRALANTVDVMWKLAGDASTDFSYYTKRATLAGVYGSTLVYWLNDNSPQQSDTGLFLKRRLGNVAAFGRMKIRLKTMLKAS